MTDKIHTGQCLCSKIRFQTEGLTVWIGYCHCQSCRRATGAAVTHVGLNPSSLKFTRAAADDDDWKS